MRREANVSATFSRVFLAVLCFAAVAPCFCLPALAQQRVRNPMRVLPRWNAQFESVREPDRRTANRPTPPRELIRELRRAEKALEEGWHVDALEAFDQLLQDPEMGDYFLPQKEGSPDQSLKGRIYRLLGELPTEARRTYELQFGSQASQALRDALAQGDISQVEEVSRRYFHTEAGREATYLLARYALDLGQPRTALLALERLQSFENTDELGASSGWLAVVAALATGEEEQARGALDDLRRRYPGAQLSLGGEELGVSAANDELIRRLTEYVVPQRGSTATDSAWVTSGGGAKRDRRSSGGMPLPRLQWEVPSTIDESEEQSLAGLSERFREQEVAALPVVQPVVVGEFVFARTTDLGLGINLGNGKRIWTYPADDLTAFGRRPRTNVDVEIAGGPSQLMTIQQKVWEDSVFGQLSHDHRCLYLVSDLESPGTSYTASQLQRMQLGLEEPYATATNSIVAIEYTTEGKTLWTSGGENGEDPRLRDVFFLGPPLPVADTLFAIAEIKDDVRLIAIDPANGTMRWSQLLAQIETPFHVALNPQRRLSGAVPSFADGILVCPTSSGIVVAIDLSARTLRWSYEYDNAAAGAGNLEFTPWMPGVPTSSQIGDRWLDSPAIIVDDCVLLTPAESNRIHCIDLRTGTDRWAPRQRDEGLFIGGAYNGIVAVVEAHKVRGHRLDDGERAWPPIPLPERDVPSGRGFVSEKFLYLPTTGPALLKIDLESGEIVERMVTEHVLGNLICAGDFLISQGSDSIRAYMLRDRMRERLVEDARRLPQDLDAQEAYANLLLGDGQVSEAIEVLERILSLATENEKAKSARTLLVHTALSALRQDFAKFQPLFERTKDFPEWEAHRRELLRIQAEGQVKLGQYRAAAETFLELARRILQEGVSLESETYAHPEDGDVRLSEFTWVSIRLRDVIKLANDKERAEIVQLLASFLRDQSEARFPIELHSIGRDLSMLPEFEGLESELTERMPNEKELLASELWLTHRMMRGPTHAAISAARALGELQLRRQRPWVALKALDRAAAMAKDLSEEDRSGLSETLVKLKESRAALEREISGDLWSWPMGKVQAANAPPDPDPAGLQNMMPLTIEDAQGVFDDGQFAAFESQARQLILLDAHGHIRSRIGLPNSDRLLQTGMPSMSAKACGDLIVFALGSRLVAVNALESDELDSPRQLWQKELEGATPMARPGRRQAGFHVQQRDNPFLGRQNVVRIIANPSMALANLGPVQPHAVCYLTPAGLECVDALSGHLRWRRRGVESSDILFGDDEHVYVTLPGDQRTSVISLDDGRKVGERRIPPASQHWATRGRLVLAFERRRTLYVFQQQKLFLWDPWEEKRLWERTFENGTLGALVGLDEIAMLRPNGELEILELATGRTRIKYTFTLKNKPTAIDVLRSHDQYTVLVSVNDDLEVQTLQRRGVILRGPVMGSRFRYFSGPVMALDRVSGAPRWPRPARVTQYFLPSIQPAELPFLPLYRSVQRQVIQPQGGRPGTRPMEMQNDLSILDLRTGRVAWEAASPPGIWRMMLLRGDPRADSVQLITERGPGDSLRLTSEPVESEGPAELKGVDLESPRSGSTEPGGPEE